MFILDGNILPLDTPFEHDGVRYPANWLRLVSPQERAPIGITEAPDPESYDQRFYWGPGMPKDHAPLVEEWAGRANSAAHALLAPTDWMVIREKDVAVPVPEEVKTWRALIRDEANIRTVEVQSTASTEELEALVTAPDWDEWPPQP
jgi:hypothetical protein